MVTIKVQAMKINCKDKYLEKAKELDTFFINTFFEKKWGLNKNIPFHYILKVMMNMDRVGYGREYVKILIK